MKQRGGLAYLLSAVFLALPTISWTQEGVVLDRRPEGIVVDAGQMPGIKPGARLGFVRLEGGRREIGQGQVQDVREGRALAILTSSADVRQGDLAVLCPVPGQPGPFQDLRSMVGQIRSQAAQPGIQTNPQLQTKVDQLELALNTRDGAIQQGLCDTSEHDRQIAALAMEVQSLSSGQQAGMIGQAQQTGSPQASDPLSSTVDAIAKLGQVIQSLASTFKSPAGSAQGQPSPSALIDPGATTPTPYAPTPPATPQPSQASPLWWKAPKIPASSPTTPTQKPQIVAQPFAPLAMLKLGNITGQVRNQQGQPLAGARVEIKSLSASTQTNYEGKFTLQKLTPGQHQVTASASGFISQTLPVGLAEGGSASHNFTLQRLLLSPQKKPLAPIGPQPLRKYP